MKLVLKLVLPLFAWLSASTGVGASPLHTAIDRNPLQTAQGSHTSRPGGCKCDPLKHFSPFTTCKVIKAPHKAPHIQIMHTQHKRCHPLSVDFFKCIDKEASLMQFVQSRCRYEETLDECKVHPLSLCALLLSAYLIISFRVLNSVARAERDAPQDSGKTGRRTRAYSVPLGPLRVGPERPNAPLARLTSSVR
jgi:hypothetical protein